MLLLLLKPNCPQENGKPNYTEGFGTRSPLFFCAYPLSLTSTIDFSTTGHVGQEETPSRNPACTLSKHFRNGSLPSRFSGKKEVEKRERNNTPGRAFSADRFTAKHLTMLGLFGVHFSIRRAEKKKRMDLGRWPNLFYATFERGTPKRPSIVKCLAVKRQPKMPQHTTRTDVGQI